MHLCNIVYLLNLMKSLCDLVYALGKTTIWGFNILLILPVDRHWTLLLVSSYIQLFQIPSPTHIELKHYGI
jgi:hypothetical protein